MIEPSSHDRTGSAAKDIYVIPLNRTVSDMVGHEVSVCIDVYTGPEAGIFRVGPADDVLRLLADAHETEFTIGDLVAATGASRSTVWRAVDLLDDIGVVVIRETPQRNYVRIDVDRLEKADPILAIEQSAFRAPIRQFVDRIRTAVGRSDAVDGVVGVVVFGSVARGEADRRSDIDLFVLVEGDRTTARRVVTDVVTDLESRRFDGDRFEFEPYVESIDSAHRAGSKLSTIFEEGITILDSDHLSSVRRAAFR